MISALANARADVLVRLRDEASHDVQRAVDSAREELPDNLHVKRAVSERPADRGIRYAPAPRAPLGS